MVGQRPHPLLPPVQSEDGSAATKIVATLGPASEDRLDELIDAGLSVARINFAHGSAMDHERRVAEVRAAERRCGVAIGILADIQGPKLRLGRFTAGERELIAGAHVRLAERALSSAEDELPFDFQGFAQSLEPGDRVFLADGAVELLVESLEAGAAKALVRRGGLVGDRKGVHLPDSKIALELPTERDRADIALAKELGVDMLGISFVSRAEEIDRIGDLAPGLSLVAKIERRVAVENLRSILEAADGLMVARGDLGVELPLEQLPLVQKSIIHEALQAGRFVITATEMLESMVRNSRPTRAEVTDVANAVLDGTDAVMLSAETAVGSYPVESVAAMSRIARAAESSERYREAARTGFRASEPTFSNATALGAASVAEALSIRKIVCFTESGNTVRLLSRYRSAAEIIALTPSERTLRSMTVLSHVRPHLFPRTTSLEDMLHESQALLLEKGLVLHGEEVIFVAGVPPGVSRSTNVMKLHRIGEATRLH